MNINKISQQGWQDDNNLRVQWLLGNQCSMKCDYCPEWFNNGKNPWPDLETVENFVEALGTQYQSRNRLINFSLVGGEITEFPYILALLQGLTDKGIKSEIMTNASAPVSFWERAAPNLSQVIISYHNRRVTWPHIQSVITVLLENEVDVLLQFMMVPDQFDEILRYKAQAEVFRDSIAETFNIQLRPLFKDYGQNRKLYDYTPEQAHIIATGEKPSLEIKKESGETIQTSATQKTMKQDHNYKGMYCYVGMEQLVVYSNGDIYRGWCFEGGPLGNVNTGFVAPTEPIICTKDYCKNGMDQLTTKSKTEL